MQFKEILINNFQSYAGEHKVEFPYKSGLYLVKGSNNKDESLGSNGSGKSAYTHSISWCLFGKTPNGMRSNSIQTWGKEDETTFVEVVFTVGTDLYRLYRSQNPNKLRISINDSKYKTIQQTDLEQKLNISFEALPAFLISQFHQGFVDLTPAQRLDLFTDLLNLSYWDERIDLVKQEYSDIEKEVVSAETQLSNIDGVVESARVRALRSKQLADEFEEEKQNHIKHYQGYVEELKTELNQTFTSLKESQEEQKTLSKQCKNVEKEFSTIRKDLEAVQENVSEYKSEIKVTQSKKSDLEDWLTHFTGLDSVCPTCLQEVGSDHVLEQRSDLSTKINKLEEDEKELIEKIRKIDKNVANLYKKEEDKREELQKSNSFLDQLSNEITRLNNNLPKLEGKLEKAKGAVELEQSKRNEYQIDYKKCLEEQHQAEHDKIEIQQFIKDANEYLDALSFWKKGFKEIKLMLVREAINILEVEMNTITESLGMGDWNISCEMEKETKSTKTMKKGFHVLVNPPGEEEKPINAFSGGERQRLGLAGTLALASLIRNKTGFRPNLMILDEPAKHLSEQGQQQLIDDLYERAIQDNRVIILIDHHSAVVGGNYNGVYNVTKDDSGYSTIEYSE